MQQLRGEVNNVYHDDSGDWFITFAIQRRLTYRTDTLWAAADVGQRLDYLFRYGADYAPTFTGVITLDVVIETGQIVDFYI